MYINVILYILLYSQQNKKNFLEISSDKYEIILRK